MQILRIPTTAKYVREGGYVPITDQAAFAPVLVAQSTNRLSPDNVHLRMQKSPPHRHLALLVREATGQVFQLLVSK